MKTVAVATNNGNAERLAPQAEFAVQSSVIIPACRLQLLDAGERLEHEPGKRLWRDIGELESLDVDIDKFRAARRSTELLKKVVVLVRAADLKWKSSVLLAASS